MWGKKAHVEMKRAKDGKGGVPVRTKRAHLEGGRNGYSRQLVKKNDKKVFFSCRF